MLLLAGSGGMLSIRPSRNFERLAEKRADLIVRILENGSVLQAYDDSQPAFLLKGLASIENLVKGRYRRLSEDAKDVAKQVLSLQFLIQ